MKNSLVDMLNMLKRTTFFRHYCLPEMCVDFQHIKFEIKIFPGTKAYYNASGLTGELNTLHRNLCVFFSSVIQFAGVNFTQRPKTDFKGSDNLKKTEKNISGSRKTGLKTALFIVFPHFFSHIYI